MPSFSEEDKRRLFAFYNPAIDSWGPNDARSLRWTGDMQQTKRFQTLCEVGVHDRASILDVGCGFGDLYHYLASRYPRIHYLGIDINPSMIALARRKYPDAAFEVADFGDWEGSPRDFCLASGAFSFAVADHKEVYFSYVKKMFAYSRVAVACNFLDARSHISDETFAAYDPKEIYDFCRMITPRVKLRDDYLPQDFTAYLYH